MFEIESSFKFITQNVCRQLFKTLFMSISLDKVHHVCVCVFLLLCNLEAINFKCPFLLQTINLAENNITIIEKLSFKDLYLVNINLSRNSIEKIEVGAFENCNNITTLDLSHNQITEIPKKAFDEFSYAMEFLLSFNKLTSLNQV